MSSKEITQPPIDWAGTISGILYKTVCFSILVIHMVFTGGRGAWEKCREEWDELEQKKG